MDYKILYAPDYGVPQIRKRVFFVGSKIGKFEFPKITHKENGYVTCKEAIGDLPSLAKKTGNEEADYQAKATSKYQETMRKGSKKLLNHVRTNHQQHVIDVIRKVPEGGNHKDLPKGVGDSRKFNEAWTAYNQVIELPHPMLPLHAPRYLHLCCAQQCGSAQGVPTGGVPLPR